MSYIRDVQGNIQAIYENGVCVERPLYGASRLGRLNGVIAGTTTREYRQTGITEYEVPDHLGNVRAVVGDVRLTTGEVDHTEKYYYYPYGFLREGGSYRYGYNGMQREDAIAGAGNTYTTEHRMLSSLYGRWFSTDPMTGDAPSWTPYNAMWGNPILNVDPSGDWALEVSKNNANIYTVVGGTADSDKYIYVVDKSGKRTGQILGEMLTEYSFHDEKGNAILGVNINLNDQSGQNFFSNQVSNVGLFKYIGNAQGGQDFDFKRDGTEPNDENYNNPQYHYRGMPFVGKIASARDIGNYAAGYVAGVHGISWGASRIAFDALETKQTYGTWEVYKWRSWEVEGQPTQRAERAGHHRGYLIYQQKKFEREWQKMINPWTTGAKW